AGERTPLREAPAVATTGDELELEPQPGTELVHADLRELLPGVEPDRQVDDWGRSERIEGMLDATVSEFLYRLWFRCEVEGIENVYQDRYRLRRFGRGGFVEAAMRAQVPIVPIAVVGAEEAAPIFAHVPLLQRLTGLIYFPITPTFPHLGLLGMLGYLPAKFRIRFLEPIPTDALGDEPWNDKGLVQTVAD